MAGREQTRLLSGHHSGGRRLAHHSTTPPPGHQPIYSTAGILNHLPIGRPTTSSHLYRRHVCPLHRTLPQRLQRHIHLPHSAFFKPTIKKQLCRGFGLCPRGERADPQGFEEGCREERRRLSVLLGKQAIGGSSHYCSKEHSNGVRRTIPPAASRFDTETPSTERLLALQSVPRRIRPAAAICGCSGRQAGSQGGQLLSSWKRRQAQRLEG